MMFLNVLFITVPGILLAHSVCVCVCVFFGTEYFLFYMCLHPACHIQEKNTLDSAAAMRPGELLEGGKAVQGGGGDGTPQTEARISGLSPCSARPFRIPTSVSLPVI